MEYNLEEIDHLIRNRRSVYPKVFTGEIIDDSIVLKLLENANWAPNHKHTEPWRFKVFKEEGKNRMIENFKKYYLENTSEENISSKKLQGFQVKKEKTSHLIAIIVDLNSEEKVPEIEEYMAVACAIQNLYLSATANGLGGYWSTGKYTYSDSGHSSLKLSANQKLLGFFYLGVPKNIEIRATRKAVSDKIEWIDQ